MENKNDMLVVLMKAEAEMRQENKRLRAENAILKDDIEMFKKFVDMLMRNDRMVYRDDEIRARPVPVFVFEENLEGEPILVRKRNK